MGACQGKSKQKDKFKEKKLDSKNEQYENSNDNMNTQKVADKLGVDLQGETACKSVYYKNYFENEENNEYYSENQHLSIQEFSQNLIFLQPLGEGSFGKVHKAFSKMTGKFYAIKFTAQQLNEDLNRKMKYELHIMRKLNEINNQNIIKMIYSNSIIPTEAQNKGLDQNIIMESGSCTLRDILKEGRTYKEEDICSFLYEICIALNDCQKKRIVHRDLKPENLILNEFNTKYILSDFGEAIIMPEDTDIIEEFFVGTPSYMSYEMYIEYLYWTSSDSNKNLDRRLKYNPFLADISSLGIIVMELMGISKKSRADVRKGGQIPEDYYIKYPKTCPLVQQMMINTQYERPDYDKILKTIKTWKHSPFIETQYANKAKYKLYSNLDYKSLVAIAQLYSKIERNLENEILCSYILNNYESFLDKPTSRNINQLYGEALIAKGNYDLAIEHLQKAYTIIQNLEEKDSIDLANIQILMAKAYSYNNDKAKGDEHLNQAQFEYQMKYGQQHPEFGIILFQKGQLNLVVKNFEQAILAFKGAITCFELEMQKYIRQLSKSHRHLAFLYIKQNQSDLSIKHLEQSLSLNKQYYGTQLNYEEIYIYETYAAAYSKTNVQQSEEYSQKAKEIKDQLIGESTGEKFLNEDYEAQIIQSANDLVQKLKLKQAKTLLEQDMNDYKTQIQIKEAIKNHKDIKIFYQNIYGMECIEVAEVEDKIGQLYIKLESPQKANKALEQCLNIRQKLYGNKDSAQQEILKQLAEIQISLKNEYTALEWHDKYCQLKKANSQEFTTVLEQIGNLYYDHSFFNSALKYYKQCYELRKNLLGEGHEDTLNILQYIFLTQEDIASETKFYEEALNYGEQLLNLRIKHIGLVNEINAKLLEKIVNMYEDIGDYEKQFQQSLKLEEILDKLYNGVDERLAFIKIRLGHEYENRNLKTAENKYKEAIKICYQLQKKDTKLTFYALRDYGICLALQKRHIEAIENYEKSKSLIIEIQGTSNSDLADLYYYMATSYTELNQKSKSITILEECLKMHLQFEGQNNLRAAYICKDLGFNYAYQDNNKKAIESMNKAIDILMKLPGNYQKEINNYQAIVTDLKKLAKF